MLPAFVLNETCNSLFRQYWLSHSFIFPMLYTCMYVHHQHFLLYDKLATGQNCLICYFIYHSLNDRNSASPNGSQIVHPINPSFRRPLSTLFAHAPKIASDNYRVRRQLEADSDVTVTSRALSGDAGGGGCLSAARDICGAGETPAVPAADRLL